MHYSRFCLYHPLLLTDRRSETAREKNVEVLLQPQAVLETRPKDAAAAKALKKKGTQAMRTILM